MKSAVVQSYTDGQLMWVPDNGVWLSEMPRPKGILSEDELWSIVAYLWHLPTTGSQGTP